MKSFVHFNFIKTIIYSIYTHFKYFLEISLNCISLLIIPIYISHNRLDKYRLSLGVYLGKFLVLLPAGCMPLLYSASIIHRPKTAILAKIDINDLKDKELEQYHRSLIQTLCNCDELPRELSILFNTVESSRVIDKMRHDPSLPSIPTVRLFESLQEAKRWKEDIAETNTKLAPLARIDILSDSYVYASPENTLKNSPQQTLHDYKGRPTTPSSRARNVSINSPSMRLDDKSPARSPGEEATSPRPQSRHGNVSVLYVADYHSRAEELAQMMASTQDVTHPGTGYDHFDHTPAETHTFTAPSQEQYIPPVHHTANQSFNQHNSTSLEAPYDMMSWQPSDSSLLSVGSPGLHANTTDINSSPSGTRAAPSSLSHANFEQDVLEKQVSKWFTTPSRKSQPDLKRPSSLGQSSTGNRRSGDRNDQSPSQARLFSGIQSDESKSNPNKSENELLNRSLFTPIDPGMPGPEEYIGSYSHQLYPNDEEKGFKDDNRNEETKSIPPSNQSTAKQRTPLGSKTQPPSGISDHTISIENHPPLLRDIKERRPSLSMSLSDIDNLLAGNNQATSGSSFSNPTNSFAQVDMIPQTLAQFTSQALPTNLDQMCKRASILNLAPFTDWNTSNVSLNLNQSENRRFADPAVTTLPSFPTSPQGAPLLNSEQDFQSLSESNNRDLLNVRAILAGIGMYREFVQVYPQKNQACFSTYALHMRHVPDLDVMIVLLTDSTVLQGIMLSLLQDIERHVREESMHHAITTNNIDEKLSKKSNQRSNRSYSYERRDSQDASPEHFGPVCQELEEAAKLLINLYTKEYNLVSSALSQQNQDGARYNSLHILPSQPIIMGQDSSDMFNAPTHMNQHYTVYLRKMTIVCDYRNTFENKMDRHNYFQLLNNVFMHQIIYRQGISDEQMSDNISVALDKIQEQLLHQQKLLQTARSGLAIGNTWLAQTILMIALVAAVAIMGLAMVLHATSK